MPIFLDPRRILNHHHSLSTESNAPSHEHRTLAVSTDPIRSRSCSAPVRGSGCNALIQKIAPEEAGTRLARGNRERDGFKKGDLASPGVLYIVLMCIASNTRNKKLLSYESKQVHRRFCSQSLVPPVIKQKLDFMA